MDISGKIIAFLPAQTGQGKNGPWKKQDFIIETADNYPKKICIAVWGDKIDLGSFKTGDQVTVSFDLESREFNGRWYTDVKAWKVNAGAGGGESTRSGKAGVAAAPTDDYPADDLPF